METNFDFYVQLVQGIVALILAISSNATVMQSLKIVVSLVVDKFFPRMQHFKIKDRGSFVFAAILAFIVSYYMKLDLVSAFNLQNYVSPELGVILNWALPFIGSTQFYDKFIKKSEEAVG